MTKTHYPYNKKQTKNYGTRDFTKSLLVKYPIEFYWKHC